MIFYCHVSLQSWSGCSSMQVQCAVCTTTPVYIHTQFHYWSTIGLKTGLNIFFLICIVKLWFIFSCLSFFLFFSVDVSLDPDTAHPNLILSDDGKQVRHGDTEQKLADNPKRFNRCPAVLGKEGFSSGKFYFEVQVKGKTNWDLGVATEYIKRKGAITLGPSNGYWAVWLRNRNEYKAHSTPPVSLSLRVKPQRVGVFVDYEEGLVSFYDVESSSLIYSFTGQSFTGKLYAFLNPSQNRGGNNSDPLIITPFNFNKWKVFAFRQRLSYYREMRGPVLLTIGESVTANSDHVSLNNQSHYSLEVIEFQSELCDTQSPFTDTIGMNEKCRKLNPTCRKKSVTSLIKQHFFLGKL